MQEQCMLGNHASKRVCYWWANQIIQCLNATNRHISEILGPVTVTTKQSSLSNCSVEVFASIRCQLS